MIPDPLEGASNEDKVQVTWHKIRIHGGPRNKLFDEVTRYSVQLPVLELERSCKLAITVCKSPHAITKNRHRQPIRRLQQRKFPHCWSVVQVLGSSCDSDGFVRNTLQICADLHRRHDLPHIGCNGVKSKQQTDPILINLLL